MVADAVIVVSTHLDDAVFSVGQIIAAHPDATVVTVLAAVPPDTFLTTYDASAGYTSSAQGVEIRRQEDSEACDALRATAVWGHWHDGAYEIPWDFDEVTDWLRGAFATFGGPVLLPVGISHPDHIRVAAASRTAAVGRDDVWMYEDLPYRVQFPTQTWDRLGELRSWGLSFSFGEELDSGDVDQKRAAVECYRTQLNDMTRRCVYAPERVWRLL